LFSKIDISLIVSRIEALYAYSGRGRKGGISDRGARVCRTERRSYRLGWRAHTVASMSAYPITYIVKAANANDKEMVKPLLKRASRLLTQYKKNIGHIIADSQYYSAEAFKTIREACGALQA